MVVSWFLVMVMVVFVVVIVVLVMVVVAGVKVETDGREVPTHNSCYMYMVAT